MKAEDYSAPWTLDDGPLRDDDGRIIATAEEMIEMERFEAERYPVEQGKREGVPQDEPLKGTLRTSRDKSLPRLTTTVEFDSVEWDEMTRILRWNEDPRYDGWKSWFIRNAVAEAIERHLEQMKIKAPRFSSEILRDRALRIASTLENERQTLAAILGNARGETKPEFHNIAIDLYRSTHSTEIRTQLIEHFPELHDKWL